MTKEEKINEIIEQVKNDTSLFHRYTDAMGHPQPDSLMDTLFNELQNRSCMLFAAWLPRLASVKEYTGRLSYKDAFSYICGQAQRELGRSVSCALVEKDASREEFIKALEDWEVKYEIRSGFNC